MTKLEIYVTIITVDVIKLTELHLRRVLTGIDEITLQHQSVLRVSYHEDCSVHLQQNTVCPNYRSRGRESRVAPSCCC